MITLREPDYLDCATLVVLLRPQDRAEMEAARGGLTAAELREACREAIDARAVYDDHKLICIFGLNPHPSPGVAVPWLLGTQVLDRYRVALCHYARPILNTWNAAYPTLTNFTDKRNTKIISWLRWLGFSFTDEVPLNGHTFIQFVRHVRPHIHRHDSD